jgi:hypothetical protein
LSSMKRSCRSSLRSKPAKARNGMVVNSQKYRRPLFGKPRGCDGQAANPSQLFVKLCRKNLPGATEQVFDLAKKPSRFRVRVAR